MTERTPYSNQDRKRRRAAEYNARYEAQRNRHRVEPLFRYIYRLTMPETLLTLHRRREERAKRRAMNNHAILATMLAATAGGDHG